ncbi:hypothetical protein SI859A1_01806 [Aurantimonas manganoxydans SI85-9A1]|uniref:Uncharacterized protein n=1 Tax=Aurantimonas manganoxydans (strain ATCC BAA-1229 / DSM 21871 / SI85-9A1) TaxID=287752 RepID=Q1YNN2_AURMS|nr:hypothetical protein SI859A1_01806 [Aurantimonas manganoxydans SI85-9A1]
MFRCRTRPHRTCKARLELVDAVGCSATRRRLHGAPVFRHRGSQIHAFASETGRHRHDRQALTCQPGRFWRVARSSSIQRRSIRLRRCCNTYVSRLQATRPCAPSQIGPESGSDRRKGTVWSLVRVEEGDVTIREQAGSHGDRQFNRGGNVAPASGWQVRAAVGMLADRAVFACQSLFGLKALFGGAAGVPPRLEGMAARSRRVGKSLSAARCHRPSQVLKRPADPVCGGRWFARRVQSLVSSSLHGGAGAGSAARGSSGCVLSDGRGAAWALPLRD